MSSKKYIFLLALIALLVTSCKDELIYPEVSQEEINDVIQDGYSFGFLLEDAAARTRDVNFNPGASLRLNTVWMGVFDRESGDCISRNYRLLNYSTVVSGVLQSGVVRMVLNDPVDPTGSNKNYEGNELIVVCLANFKDVKYNYEETSVGNPETGDTGDKEETDNPEGVDEDEEDNEDPTSLMYKLNHITSWDEFNEIAVDAATAFAGDHNSDTPVMAGFLYNAMKDDSSHIKIDQYKQYEEDQNGNHGVYLSPNMPDVYASMIVKYGPINNQATNKVYYTEEKVDNENIKKVLVNQGMTLHMRRLVANINVDIQVTPESNLELTETTYKRFNMPKAVYIIERRTTDCTIISENINGKNVFKADPNSEAKFSYHNDKYEAIFSPNYSDLNPAEGYTDDTTWQPTQSTTSFSFQHFANKHWSDLDLDVASNKLKYKGRNNEDIFVNRADKNGTSDVFTALMGPDATTTDFRNYASYFIVKMHLVDKTTGKAYEAEYTIFEGNTSDELGTQIWADSDQTIPKGTPKDFVCARNINYYYKIIVKGADNIYHNVTKNAPLDHSSGQGGKVWDFRYVNNTYNADGKLIGDNNCTYDPYLNAFENTISFEGGVYENAVIIKNENPNLAFRLYGYNTEALNSDLTPDPRIEGFNFNFSDDSFKLLRGLWPEPSGSYSHYYHDIDDLEKNKDSNGNTVGIPENMLSGLRFIKCEGDYTNFTNVKENIQTILEEYNSDNTNLGVRKVLDVKQLMLYYTGGKESESDDKWHMWVSASNIEKQTYVDRMQYVRAIYIADRNGEVDSDGCTTLVTIFAAAQYPEYDEITDADKKQIELPVFEKGKNFIEVSGYNVVDQYVKEFRVPTIEGLDLNYYEYELKVDGNVYPHSGKTTSYYTYNNIPVSAITKGEITLKAISTEVNRLLADSKEQTIGKITLSNHPVWKYNETEWESAITWFKAHTNWTDNDIFKGNYLRFFFDISTSTVSLRKFDPYHEDNNQDSYFKIAGANWIEIKIYEPCTITVSGRTQNTGSTNQRRIDFKLNSLTNIVKEGPLTTTASSGTVGKWDDVTMTIDSKTPGWEDGENIIYLNPANGEVAIRSIEIKK
ncbi:MAG: hypothetical protein J1F67_08655 [Muribaculaceae bacterium]|nr:hypothetical protein [Muribaculaceae bacterium]